MIFGNLLTSGNYDQKGKTVGGKNGIGSKACNIYSERFDIELVDSKRNKKYFQRFKNNMYDKEEPVITDVPKNSESYIKITFVPDYKKFGLKGLTKDMASLFKRRVYDVAGTTNSLVKVYYNDKLLEIKSFEDYIKMYYADENINLIYQEFNERWSVGVVFDTNSGYQHMTFVNKISTFQGGTHLNYIANQIIDKVTTHITDKHKNLKIKPSQIKDNITVFINAVIEDPSFSSQTKESLTTKSSLFNIKCELDDKFIQKICRTGLVEELVQVAQIKQLAELEKSDGKKNTNLKNLPKLDVGFSSNNS
jgi:DNA topoisomerase-2